MIISHHLFKVFVLPEHQGEQNVVSRVHWIIRFESEGYTSDAFVETFLDTNNLQDFVPAAQIGNERILQWAFNAQGGDAFVAQLITHHAERIEYQKQCAGQEEFSEGFEFLAPAANPTIPSVVL